MALSVGLDVGGAHLKVACARDGQIVEVVQIPCPLWQGMEHLDHALAGARRLTDKAERISITMTGELSDLFTDRREGVETLVARLSTEFGDAVRFWMGRRGFGNASEAIQHHADVASTNFLATAQLAGARLSDALLVDMGSTTTDVIAVKSGRPAVTGYSDADRLATRELVYTGLTRTAVMGVATWATFKGQEQGLCREYLATMADVRRILGDLRDGVDQHATADGRGKSIEESVGRLARMFGRDAADGTLSDWRDAAAKLDEAQLVPIREACSIVSARAGLPDGAPFVLAGIGAAVLADGLAKALGRDCVTFGKLAGAGRALSDAATGAAPATAVALL